MPVINMRHGAGAMLFMPLKGREGGGGGGGGVM